MKRLFIPTLIASMAAAMLVTAMPETSAWADKKLRDRGPVTCRSSKTIKLNRVRIVSNGPAILVEGACDIIIRNSHIESKGKAVLVRGSGDVRVTGSVVIGKDALVVQGSGDIRINGSNVNGSDHAAKVEGSGDIVIRGSTVKGKKKVRGTGEVRDDGDNSWR